MNPYVQQAMQQNGASESEVRKSSKQKSTRNFPCIIGLRHYETEEEYLDALHEFLNGC